MTDPCLGVPTWNHTHIEKSIRSNTCTYNYILTLQQSSLEKKKKKKKGGRLQTVFFFKTRLEFSYASELEHIRIDGSMRTRAPGLPTVLELLAFDSSLPLRVQLVADALVSQRLAGEHKQCG